MAKTIPPSTDNDLKKPVTDGTGIYHPDTDARSATVSAEPKERAFDKREGSDAFSTNNALAADKKDLLGPVADVKKSQDTNEGFGEFNVKTASAQITDQLGANAVTDAATLKNLGTGIKDTGLAPTDGSASRDLDTQNVVSEPTPFMTFLEIDNQWAIRVNGMTVYLPAKHEISGMPAQGIFQMLCQAVNKAMDPTSSTATTTDKVTVR